jgi:hypothetical protein
LAAYDFAYVVSRVDFDFSSAIVNCPIFFHRGISSYLCVFTWLFESLSQKQDVIIFGEDIIMQYLPREHCNVFVNGIAFHRCDEDEDCVDEIDDPISRKIYKCHISERYDT